jgi:hypothetical protein
MFYHTDCSHILNVEEGSMMVSDGGWKDYTNQYLSSCPVCENKYPYMKYLDDSVREDVENLVYRIWSLGCADVYVPTFQKRVDTIRLKNIEIERLEKRLKSGIVDSIDEDEDDIVLKPTK